MKLFAGLVLCCVVACLAGCRTAPSDAARKAGLKTVSIEPRVDADNVMRYGADIGGGAFYALGALVMDATGKEGIAQMATVMHTNGIVVADMVREQVTEYLKTYPDLKWSDDDADGVFVIKIMQYGFDTPGMKATKKVPFVVLRLALYDRNGKIIWCALTQPTDWTANGIGAPWEEYEANPERLRADWNAQIKHVVPLLFPAKK